MENCGNINTISLLSEALCAKRRIHKESKSKSKTNRNCENRNAIREI